MEYTALQRKKQKHSMKSKEWIYLIYQTVNLQILEKKYYYFATANIVPNVNVK